MLKQSIIGLRKVVRQIHITANSVFGAIILSAVLLSGCATQWTPSWSEAGPSRPGVESERRLEAARAALERADNAMGVKAAIGAYRAVLEADPASIEALTRLSSLHILTGTAYTGSGSAKSDRFAEAMKYAELAMYTNPAFKESVNAGARPWEAADSLTRREAEPAMLWVTALQYEFKECMGLIGKIVNVRRLQHGLTIAQRVEAVAPEFGGGSVELALAISYFSLPGSMGGDDALGEQYMEKAVAKDHAWLVGRWARGKYYEDLSGNDDGVIEDLKRVASADLSEYKDPYPWRVHFREDARQLLGNR